jgi:predicted nucleic acid-binding protein
VAIAFFDSNILLYAAMRGLPPRDQYKRQVAQELIETEEFGISGQVLAEFYSNIVKKGPAPFSHDEALEWVSLLAEKPCIPVDSNLVVDGGSLAKRYNISYWDGAIIAAAHIAGAKTLYSEDLNDGQLYGDVVVVNPFKSLVH